MFIYLQYVILLVHFKVFFSVVVILFKKFQQMWRIWSETLQNCTIQISCYPSNMLYPMESCCSKGCSIISVKYCIYQIENIWSQQNCFFFLRFSTSWQTLMWVPDSFFTALLGGRIPSLRDETGAIFVDRDPTMFSVILNYLRTKDVDLRDVNIRALRHEADYFGITPLSRRLALCDEMSHSSCGDVLFYGYLPPPGIKEFVLILYRT